MMFKVKAKFDKNAKKYLDVYINLDKINYIAKNEVMLDKGLCYLDDDSLKSVTRYLNFISTLANAFSTMSSDESAKTIDAVKYVVQAAKDKANGSDNDIDKKQSSTISLFFKKILRRINAKS